MTDIYIYDKRICSYMSDEYLIEKGIHYSKIFKAYISYKKIYSSFIIYHLMFGDDLKEKIKYIRTNFGYNRPRKKRKKSQGYHRIR